MAAEQSADMTAALACITELTQKDKTQTDDAVTKAKECKDQSSAALVELKEHNEKKLREVQQAQCAAFFAQAFKLDTKQAAKAEKHLAPDAAQYAATISYDASAKKEPFQASEKALSLDQIDAFIDAFVQAATEIKGVQGVEGKNAAKWLAGGDTGKALSSLQANVAVLRAIRTDGRAPKAEELFANLTIAPRLGCLLLLRDMFFNAKQREVYLDGVLKENEKRDFYRFMAQRMFGKKLQKNTYVALDEAQWKTQMLTNVPKVDTVASAPKMVDVTEVGPLSISVAAYGLTTKTREELEQGALSPSVVAQGQLSPKARQAVMDLRDATLDRLATHPPSKDPHDWSARGKAESRGFPDVNRFSEVWARLVNNDTDYRQVLQGVAMQIMWDWIRSVLATLVTGSTPEDQAKEADTLLNASVVNGIAMLAKRYYKSMAFSGGDGTTSAAYKFASVALKAPPGASPDEVHGKPIRLTMVRKSSYDKVPLIESTIEALGHFFAKQGAVTEKDAPDKVTGFADAIYRHYNKEVFIRAGKKTTAGTIEKMNAGASILAVSVAPVYAAALALRDVANNKDWRGRLASQVDAADGSDTPMATFFTELQVGGEETVDVIYDGDTVWWIDPDKAAAPISPIRKGDGGGGGGGGGDASDGGKGKGEAVGGDDGSAGAAQSTTASDKDAFVDTVAAATAAAVRANDAGGAKVAFDGKAQDLEGSDAYALSAEQGDAVWDALVSETLQALVAKMANGAAEPVATALVEALGGTSATTEVQTAVATVAHAYAGEAAFVTDGSPESYRVEVGSKAFVFDDASSATVGMSNQVTELRTQLAFFTAAEPVLKRIDAALTAASELAQRIDGAGSGTHKKAAAAVLALVHVPTLAALLAVRDSLFRPERMKALEAETAEVVAFWEHVFGADLASAKHAPTMKQHGPFLAVRMATGEIAKYEAAAKAAYAAGTNLDFALDPDGKSFGDVTDAMSGFPVTLNEVGFRDELLSQVTAPDDAVLLGDVDLRTAGYLAQGKDLWAKLRAMERIGRSNVPFGDMKTAAAALIGMSEAAAADASVAAALDQQAAAYMGMMAVKVDGDKYVLRMALTGDGGSTPPVIDRRLLSLPSDAAPVERSDVAADIDALIGGLADTVKKGGFGEAVRRIGPAVTQAQQMLWNKRDGKDRGARAAAAALAFVALAPVLAACLALRDSLYHVDAMDAFAQAVGGDAAPAKTFWQTALSLGDDAFDDQPVDVNPADYAAYQAWLTSTGYATKAKAMYADEGASNLAYVALPTGDNGAPELHTADKPLYNMHNAMLHGLLKNVTAPLVSMAVLRNNDARSAEARQAVLDKVTSDTVVFVQQAATSWSDLVDKGNAAVGIVAQRARDYAAREPKLASFSDEVKGLIADLAASYVYALQPESRPVASGGNHMVVHVKDIAILSLNKSFALDEPSGVLADIMGELSNAMDTIVALPGRDVANAAMAAFEEIMNKSTEEAAVNRRAGAAVMYVGVVPVLAVMLAIRDSLLCVDAMNAVRVKEETFTALWENFIIPPKDHPADWSEGVAGEASKQGSYAAELAAQARPDYKDSAAAAYSRYGFGFRVGLDDKTRAPQRVLHPLTPASKRKPVADFDEPTSAFTFRQIIERAAENAFKLNVAFNAAAAVQTHIQAFRTQGAADWDVVIQPGGLQQAGFDAQMRELIDLAMPPSTFGEGARTLVKTEAESYGHKISAAKAGADGRLLSAEIKGKGGSNVVLPLMDSPDRVVNAMGNMVLALCDAVAEVSDSISVLPVRSLCRSADALAGMLMADGGEKAATAAATAMLRTQVYALATMLALRDCLFHIATMNRIYGSKEEDAKGLWTAAFRGTIDWDALPGNDGGSYAALNGNDKDTYEGAAALAFSENEAEEWNAQFVRTQGEDYVEDETNPLGDLYGASGAGGGGGGGASPNPAQTQPKLSQASTPPPSPPPQSKQPKQPQPLPPPPQPDVNKADTFTEAIADAVAAAFEDPTGSDVTNAASDMRARGTEYVQGGKAAYAIFQGEVTDASVTALHAAMEAPMRRIVAVLLRSVTGAVAPTTLANLIGGLARHYLATTRIATPDGGAPGAAVAGAVHGVTQPDGTIGDLGGALKTKVQTALAKLTRFDMNVVANAAAKAKEWATGMGDNDAAVAAAVITCSLYQPVLLALRDSLFNIEAMKELAKSDTDAMKAFWEQSLQLSATLGGSAADEVVAAVVDAAAAKHPYEYRRMAEGVYDGDEVVDDDKHLNKRMPLAGGALVDVDDPLNFRTQADAFVSSVVSTLSDAAQAAEAKASRAEAPLVDVFAKHPGISVAVGAIASVRGFDLFVPRELETTNKDKIKEAAKAAVKASLAIIGANDTRLMGAIQGLSDAYVSSMKIQEQSGQYTLTMEDGTGKQVAGHVLFGVRKREEFMGSVSALIAAVGSALNSAGAKADVIGPATAIANEAIAGASALTASMSSGQPLSDADYAAGLVLCIGAAAALAAALTMRDVLLRLATMTWLGQQADASKQLWENAFGVTAAYTAKDAYGKEAAVAARSNNANYIAGAKAAFEKNGSDDAKNLAFAVALSMATVTEETDPMGGLPATDLLENVGAFANAAAALAPAITANATAWQTVFDEDAARYAKGGAATYTALSTREPEAVDPIAAGAAAAVAKLTTGAAGGKCLKSLGARARAYAAGFTYAFADGSDGSVKLTLLSESVELEVVQGGTTLRTADDSLVGESTNLCDTLLGAIPDDNHRAALTEAKQGLAGVAGMHAKLVTASEQAAYAAVVTATVPLLGALLAIRDSLLSQPLMNDLASNAGDDDKRKTWGTYWTEMLAIRPDFSDAKSDGVWGSIAVWAAQYTHKKFDDAINDAGASPLSAIVLSAGFASIQKDPFNSANIPKTEEDLFKFGQAKTYAVIDETAADQVYAYINQAIGESSTGAAEKALFEKYLPMMRDSTKTKLSGGALVMAAQRVLLLDRGTLLRGKFKLTGASDRAQQQVAAATAAKSTAEAAQKAAEAQMDAARKAEQAAKAQVATLQAQVKAKDGQIATLTKGGGGSGPLAALAAVQGQLKAAEAKVSSLQGLQSRVRDLQDYIASLAGGGTNPGPAGQLHGKMSAELSGTPPAIDSQWDQFPRKLAAKYVAQRKELKQIDAAVDAIRAKLEGPTPAGGGGTPAKVELWNGRGGLATKEKIAKVEAALVNAWSDVRDIANEVGAIDDKTAADKLLDEARNAVANVQQLTRDKQDAKDKLQELQKDVQTAEQALLRHGEWATVSTDAPSAAGQALRSALDAHMQLDSDLADELDDTKTSHKEVAQPPDPADRGKQLSLKLVTNVNAVMKKVAAGNLGTPAAEAAEAKREGYAQGANAAIAALSSKVTAATKPGKLGAQDTDSRSQVSAKLNTSLDAYVRAVRKLEKDKQNAEKQVTSLKAKTAQLQTERDAANARAKLAEAKAAKAAPAASTASMASSSAAAAAASSSRGPTSGATPRVQSAASPRPAAVVTRYKQVTSVPYDDKARSRLSAVAASLAPVSESAVQQSMATLRRMYDFGYVGEKTRHDPAVIEDANKALKAAAGGIDPGTPQQTTVNTALKAGSSSVDVSIDTAATAMANKNVDAQGSLRTYVTELLKEGRATDARTIIGAAADADVTDAHYLSPDGMLNLFADYLGAYIADPAATNLTLEVLFMMDDLYVHARDLADAAAKDAFLKQRGNESFVGIGLKLP